jgi:ribosomal protein S18 acetylase RimI-like enzyme
MQLQYRKVTRQEIEYAVECHCRVCHVSNNFRNERPTYEAFRAVFQERGAWEESRAHIMKSLEDDRTLLDIVETNEGKRIGFFWVVFSDWYEQHMADINDIYVEEFFRRKGIGLEMLAHIEKIVREKGANLLISSTGVDNLISQKMHQKYGFGPRRFEYQLWL